MGENAPGVAVRAVSNVESTGYGVTFALIVLWRGCGGGEAGRASRARRVGSADMRVGMVDVLAGISGPPEEGEHRGARVFGECGRMRLVRMEK